MSDQEKTILFSIKLDTGDIIKKQVDLTASIEGGKKSLAAIKKASGEASEEYQKQKIAIANLQREYKNNNNLLQTNDRIVKANKGSYEELLNTTKKMEVQLKLMGHEGQETSKEFLALSAQVGKNKEALNVFNQGINVGTSNVGRYGESLADVRAELKTLQGQLINLKPGTEQFDAAAKKAGELKDRIKDAKEATAAFTTGSKAETGLTVFKQIGGDLASLDFAGAADKAKTFSSVIKSVNFSDISGGVKNLGTSLLETGKALLANPLVLFVAAVVALGLALKGLWDDFNLGETALKESKESFDKIKGSIENVRGEIRLLDIENQKVTGKISDRDAQRAKEVERFNKEFLESKKGLHQEEKKIEEAFAKEVENITIKHFGTEKRLEASKNEQLKKLRDLQQTNEKELVTKHAKELTLIDNTISAAQAEKNAAAAKTKLDQEIADNKKEQEEFARKTEALLELNSKYQQEISKQREEAEQLRLKTEAETGEAEKKTAADKAKAAVDAEMAKQIAIANIQRDNAAFVRDLQQTEFEKKMAALDLQEAQELDREKLTQEQKAVIQESFAKKRQQLQQAEIQANLAIAQDAFNSLQVIAGDNFEAQKGIALLQVALDEAKSISALIASSTANPLNSVTFGGAGIAQFAAGIVGLVANITKARSIINSQEPPKAEHGIVLGGESHANGGTEISADGKPIAIAEKGELLTIVNKRSTGMLKNLSNLNQLGGGIPFMKNGGIPEFQSGGVALDNDRFSQSNNLVNVLRNMPRPVVAVQHILEAIGKLTSVENEASV